MLICRTFGIGKTRRIQMNKKLNMILLGVLAVFLIISTASAASATYLTDHIAGVGTMAHPNSNSEIAGCATCHGTLGSPTTSGFCTGCHAYPVFSLKVTANPTTVPTGSPTTETITVSKSNNVIATNITAAGGASVTLSGAGVSATGTTNNAGIYSTSVNPTAAGTINAAATLAGFNDGSASITVNAPAPVPVLTTITVTPATATVIVGNTRAFTASPKDQNGNPISATITWASSNTTVATIDSTGVLTAVLAGTTTVTASNGSVSGTASVTVTPTAQAPVLTTITVTPATATIVKGRTMAFTASPKDQNGSPIAAIISWSSSNVTVGTIDANGNFNALSSGTTTIKAANGTVSGTASVTVTSGGETPVLTTIEVSPATANLKAGQTKSFVAKTLDQFNQMISAIVSWASSNTSVGTIDSNGKFTALKAGTTTITATNGTISGSAAITVANSTSHHDEEDDEHDHEEHDQEEHKNHHEEDNHKVAPNKENKHKEVETEIEDENEVEEEDD